MYKECEKLAEKWEMNPTTYSMLLSAVGLEQPNRRHLPSRSIGDLNGEFENEEKFWSIHMMWVTPPSGEGDLGKPVKKPGIL